MHVVDLYLDPVNDLPKSRPAGDFQDYLATVHDQYLTKLGQVDTSDPLSKAVRSVFDVARDASKLIQSSLHQYLLGYPHLAFAETEKVFQILGPYFDVLCPPRDMAGTLDFVYRIRTSDQPLAGKDQLFHIGYEWRHNVGTMRYSIPGLPCLYLGGSLYVCWKELGEPLVGSLYLARFKAVHGKDLRVVNFGHRPRQIAGMVAYLLDKGGCQKVDLARTAAHAACWPLVAACSIRRLHQNARFQVEYVIPQLVLQWIRTSKHFDGIRYFSTHIEDSFQDPRGQVNYAFPAKTIAATGHCSDLKERFEMTEPFSWDQAMNLPVSAVKIPYMNFEVDFGKGREAYDQTEMGVVQEKLARQPTAPMP